MPRTPDPEVGGSSPTRVKPCCVLEQGAFTPQKVLVIPRKRWLRPNMTEKLFTGTIRINQPTNQPTIVTTQDGCTLKLKYNTALLRLPRTLSQFISTQTPTVAVRRRRGLVVELERRTPEREVGGSILTQVAVLCP